MKEIVINKLKDVYTELATFNFDKYAFDTETNSLRYDNVRIHGDYSSPLGISLCDGEHLVWIETRRWTKKQVVELWKYIRSQMSEDALVICHNIVYDMKVVDKYVKNCFYNYTWFDTMVASHLLNENTSNSLKNCASRELGSVTKSYDEVTTGGNAPLNSYLSGKSSEEVQQDLKQNFVEYALNDAKWTYELFGVYFPMLKVEGLEMLMKEVEMPFQRALLEMERNGVHFNQEIYEETKQKCLELTTEFLHKAMQSIGFPRIESGYPVNLNSPVQLREILFEDLGYESLEETDTGKSSTSKSVLKRLRDEESCEFCKYLLEYKKYDKMLNTFIEPMPSYVQSDGKIRASFHNTGTVTGRLSSSNPNLQQLPRPGTSDKVSIRSLFRATPGYTMVAADYSGQEVALCAHVSQDEDYIKVLRDGLDMHLYNANLVFDLGIPYDKLKKSHIAYPSLKKKYKQNGMRTKAKIFTFGILYGATKYRISDEFGCSLEEAEEYIENYFKGFSGLKEKIDELHRQIDRRGYVRSMFGRKRRFKKKYNEYLGKKVYSGKDYRQSFNFVVQSPGTDMVRAACVKLMNYKHRHPEYDVRLLMTVHDEVVLECKDEYVDVVKEDVPQVLASVGGSGLAVPMNADADVGDTYASAK